VKTAEVKKLPVHERALYFILERERVRLRKEAGYPKPWTNDERLQTHRFCNVRRMDDAVSRWLLTNWYEPYHDHPNITAACLLARTINTPEALAKVTNVVLNHEDSPVEWEEVEVLFRNYWDSAPLFNSAYIIAGRKYEDKLTTVLTRCRAAEYEWLLSGDSMEETHAALVRCEGFGSFLAGQVVADLRWAWGTKDHWRDKNVWAPPGPGSIRGIERLLVDRYEDEVVIPAYDWDTEFQGFMRVCRAELPREITDRLEAMDYQSCLCEFDKSERVLWDQGRTKRRYNGGSGDPTPSLFE
jgi:hypothetical protein